MFFFSVLLLRSFARLFEFFVQCLVRLTHRKAKFNEKRVIIIKIENRKEAKEGNETKSREREKAGKGDGGVGERKRMKNRKHIVVD